MALLVVVLEDSALESIACLNKGLLVAPKSDRISHVHVLASQCRAFKTDESETKVQRAGRLDLHVDLFGPICSHEFDAPRSTAPLAHGYR